LKVAAASAADARRRHGFHSASCSSRQLILLLSERGRLSTKTTERGAFCSSPTCRAGQDVFRTDCRPLGFVYRHQRLHRLDAIAVRQEMMQHSLMAGCSTSSPLPGFGSPCGKQIRFARHFCREMNMQSSIRTLSKGATNPPCGQLGLPRISNQVRQRKVLDQVHPKPNVERTACKMLL
jgi:hypothetical protein